MERKKIKATYRNGVIEPLVRIDLPEGQALEVEFSVLQKTPRELASEEATQTYTALIRKSEGWWIGWILEIRGVTGQERTRSELLDTLQITLREALEFDTPEASRRTESEAAIEFSVLPKTPHELSREEKKELIQKMSGSMKGTWGSTVEEIDAYIKSERQSWDREF